MNARSHLVLGGQAMVRRLPMASITKIMTAKLVLDYGKTCPEALEEVMTVSALAAKVCGTSAKLMAGDEIQVQDALYGLMLPSGNDAALVLAEHFADRLWENRHQGTKVSRFVRAMNREARDLRMIHTIYCNPHGLHSLGHQSTVQDLAHLTAEAMLSPKLKQIVSTKEWSAEIKRNGEPHLLKWKNTNKLLHVGGVDGCKTGVTPHAKYCLSATAKRGNVSLVAIVLGSEDSDIRWQAASDALEWGFRKEASMKPKPKPYQRKRANSVTIECAPLPPKPPNEVSQKPEEVSQPATMLSTASKPPLNPTETETEVDTQNKQPELVEAAPHVMAAVSARNRVVTPRERKPALLCEGDLQQKKKPQRVLSKQKFLTTGNSICPHPPEPIQEPDVVQRAPLTPCLVNTNSTPQAQGQKKAKAGWLPMVNQGKNHALPGKMSKSFVLRSVPAS